MKEKHCVSGIKQIETWTYKHLKQIISTALIPIALLSIKYSDITQYNTEAIPYQSTQLKPGLQTTSTKEILKIKDLNRHTPPITPNEERFTVETKKEEIKPLKKLTAETKEITPDMIAAVPQEIIDDLREKAIKNRENKIPAPLKANYEEYELTNGVRGILVSGIPPGKYTIWAFTTGSLNMNLSEDVLSFTFIPEDALSGIPFKRINFGFPKGFNISVSEGKNQKESPLIAVTIPNEITTTTEQSLKQFRSILLKRVENREMREKIEKAQIFISTTNAKGGLNTDPLLGRIFLTDEQGRVLSLYSDK